MFSNAPIGSVVCTVATVEKTSCKFLFRNIHFITDVCSLTLEI